jgi:NADH:ubiquinone oxidoreductase subunit 5 (subunit L)/multisubunit Na+/H+ antiporter MnhA subunit
MDMTFLLQFFIILPLVGFLISLLIPSKQEGMLSGITFLTTFLQMIGAWAFIAVWLFTGHHSLNLKDIVVFKSVDYEFFIDFNFDKITAVYLFVGSFLTFLVTTFSRYYLHREPGYKRFFNSVLFFYIGYNLVIFSGNLETLFIGWEILGISSFLLIAFYRDRYLPTKNALKVFSIYRIGDVGLILAMWMSHHLWHKNITFMQLSNNELVHIQLNAPSWIGLFISIMFLISAAAKSAQLPFSSWLPRAMEGPTPSSAIFYGSLSVHLGAFLLIRTFPFWEHQYPVRVIIVLLGLSTSIIATGIARVQSSVKSQIAYSSIAQIGLIFVEIACGWETLALFHFAGNAFLRTYQLLVSPSVVSYLIREQFYNFTPRQHTFEDSWPKRLEYSFYILCVKEFNLESVMYRIWRPLKRTGRKLDFIRIKRVMGFFISAYLVGIACLYYKSSIPAVISNFLPTIFAFIGFIMVIKSYSERKNVKMSWMLIVMNHFWIVLATSFSEKFRADQSTIYLSGIVIAGLVGYWSLHRLKEFEQELDLNQFHGHSYEYPRTAFLFLTCCLMVTGFPISPTFIGEDLIFIHIRENQFALAFFTAASFVIDGISAIRIYARVFLGPHIKTYHETPFKSS